jgi:prepilin-type N-terminal cleavage/methylation domain-containing protein
MKFARKMSGAKSMRQKGFTLIELLVGVTILAIIAIGISSVVSTDSTKGTKVIENANNIKSALLRMKADTGTFPSNLSALWTRANATATNMYSGQDQQNAWGGPYLGSQNVDTNNAILFPTIADGVNVQIAREAGINFARLYYVRTSNVPNAIILEALKKCNGTPDTTRTFANSNCRAAPGTGTTEVGTFDMKVEETN